MQQKDSFHSYSLLVMAEILPHSLILGSWPQSPVHSFAFPLALIRQFFKSVQFTNLAGKRVFFFLINLFSGKLTYDMSSQRNPENTGVCERQKICALATSNWKHEKENEKTREKDCHLPLFQGMWAFRSGHLDLDTSVSGWWMPTLKLNRICNLILFLFWLYAHLH